MSPATPKRSFPQEYVFPPPLLNKIFILFNSVISKNWEASFPFAEVEINKIVFLFNILKSIQMPFAYVDHITEKSICQEKTFCSSQKTSATATRRTTTRCVSFYSYCHTPDYLTRCIRLRASKGHLQRSMLPKQIKRQSAIDFLDISSLRELFQFLYCASHRLPFCNQGIAGNAAAMPNSIVSAGKDA